jgi:hypothetical protein
MLGRTRFRTRGRGTAGLPGPTPEIEILTRSGATILTRAGATVIARN